jgi:putative transposase
MNSTMATELVLDAMMMAVWRRRPKTPVMIHSDQGSQFGSDDFNRWCKDNQLVPSMSRRGNCWDTQSNISLSAAFDLTRAGIGVMPLR